MSPPTKDTSRRDDHVSPRRDLSDEKTRRIAARHSAKKDILGDLEVRGLVDCGNGHKLGPQFDAHHSDRPIYDGWIGESLLATDYTQQTNIAIKSAAAPPQSAWGKIQAISLEADRLRRKTGKSVRELVKEEAAKRHEAERLTGARRVFEGPATRLLRDYAQLKRELDAEIFVDAILRALESDPNRRREQLRNRIRADHEAGLTVRQIAKIHGLPKSTVTDHLRATRGEYTRNPDT
jgi:hypothetical protein